MENTQTVQIYDYYNRLREDLPTYLAQEQFEPTDAGEAETFERLFKRAFQPIVLLKDAIAVDELKASSYGGHTFTIHVPFEPNDSALRQLQYIPNWTKSTGYPDYSVGEDRQSFQLQVGVTAHGDPNAGIEAVFAEFSEYINKRNENIKEENRKLHDRLRAAIRTRREAIQLERSAKSDLLQKLRVPLRSDPQAKPVNVDVKKPVAEVRKAAASPKSKTSATYFLEPSTAQDIVETTATLGRQFETAPAVYEKLGEEDLRQVLLGTLNAVFQMQGKAEAFNVKGKTDILLDTPEGHGMVVECKFWSGEKVFVETVAQLFGYLDWRKNYAVAMMFSKRASISAVIDTAEECLRASLGALSAPRRIRGGHLVSNHTHPKDSQKTIELHTLIFDLHKKGK